MIIMIRPFHNKILKIVAEMYTCCSPPRMVLAAKMQEPTRARNHRLVFAIAHSSDFVLVCISYCFGGHLEVSFLLSLHAMHFSLGRNNLLLLAPF